MRRELVWPVKSKVSDKMPNQPFKLTPSRRALSRSLTAC
jgi:hypothetical protein